MKRISVIAILLLGFSSLAASAAPMASEQDLLPAEQAFRVSAQFKDAKTIAVNYEIADGYYMYRNRFRFESVDGVKLGKAVTPPGKIKRDATFGRVETYRNSVRVLLPVTMPANAFGSEAGNKVYLMVVSQGCADAGVCYPPLRQNLVLTVGSKEVVAAAGETVPPMTLQKPGIADLVKKSP
jgi:thiol:disulfide interchange protein DsbD